MGGGKGSAPAAPNYTPIAQSDAHAADLAAQTSADQLAWAKQQYADQEPLLQQYMNSNINVMNTDIATQNAQQQQMQVAQANAQQAQDYYTQNYQPLEKAFLNQVENYNTPARQNQMAAAAEADVASNFAQQRQSSLQSLESYGIDPSQTRFGALDLGTRISQAAAESAAGTQSRLNTEATGLGLTGEAINIGRGYPGQVAQAYSTATGAAQGATGAGQGAVGAGGAGVQAGMNSANVFGNLMGSAPTWAGIQSGFNQGAVGAMNTGFQNQLASYNSQMAVAQNQAGGIGSLVGGLGTAGIMAFAI